MAKNYFPDAYIGILQNLDNPVVLDHIDSILSETETRLRRDINFYFSRKIDELSKRTYELHDLILHYRIASTPEKLEEAKQKIAEAIARQADE